jgi:hypothetical protein
MCSTVSIVTMLWAGQLRNFPFPGRAERFVTSPNAHDGCAPHPTPYAVGTGDSLPEGKAVVALNRPFTSIWYLLGVCMDSLTVHNVTLREDIPLYVCYWDAICDSLTQHKLYITSTVLQVQYRFQLETIIRYSHTVYLIMVSVRPKHVLHL